MEFRLLGPFEARHDGHAVETLVRRQERCLLGILLLEPGATVPIHRIVDLLWGVLPPPSARGTVHTYVGRLRTALGPLGLTILTRGEGYAVEPDGHTVDAAEFTRAVTAAAAIANPADRVRLLDGAIARWHGPLLADVADDHLRGRLGGALRELRLTAAELRAETQLELDDTDRVVAELSALLTEEPTRERLAALLMTALYRSGRSADALRVYRDTRRVLIDELGIEPGPHLRSAHQRVLVSDPGLASAETPVYAVTVRGRTLPWAVGGHPALDFCNTYAGWGHDPPLPRSEWLRDFATFAVWVGHQGLTDDDTVNWLLDQAARRPADAVAVLDDARTLRGAVRATLTTTDGDGADVADRVVASFAEAAAGAAVFGRDGAGLAQWTFPRSTGLRLPLHAVAWSAAGLLADPRRLTVRRCASTTCGWLFLDRAGLRRWCSMSSCGRTAPCD
ncbi:BTAD domain-containing putative transcriptional regulator [Jiangella asiatica]|uniref:SARP family transcriptional regulator n=1 Tax=Jiangella asiatica TaxID=2530372 RepID=A0A4R5CFZ9_9ACTN|nr:BTAD domain-containing putative transcriptional regulator [Jiangella asiatica]TDD99068.1 SARP family transcriptional regulator [Jiangella asiatica]